MRLTLRPGSSVHSRLVVLAGAFACSLGLAGPAAPSQLIDRNPSHIKLEVNSHGVALITYRPYYHGALTQVPGAQTLALTPLGDADSTA